MFEKIISISKNYALVKIAGVVSEDLLNFNVVFEDDKRVYFVAETKETGTPSVDIYKLRIEEQQKIKCAEAHFRQFNDVKYRVVNKVGDLVQ